MIKKPVVISVCSGKGGVGKSFITCNLAYLFSGRYKTLIWDADIDFPNQHILFGVEPPFRINDFYKKHNDLKKYFYNLRDNLYLAACMPGEGVERKKKDLIIMNAFEQIQNFGYFDYIFIDTASGINSETIQCCAISDLICLVVSDEPTSLLDGYGFIKFLNGEIDPQKIVLIINNVIDIEDAEEIRTKFNLATSKFLKISVSILGTVPYNKKIRSSILQQEPYVKVHKNDETTKNFLNLASIIGTRFL